MTTTHLTTQRFDEFDLDPRILSGLAAAGFTHCTPIQAETLPLALAGRDVAGQAQTGTGKTAAFLVVVMQRLLTTPPAPHLSGQPRALIVAPTRELAVQIHRDTLLLAAHTGLRAGLVYGGTGYQQQRDELAAGVDLLIGTPGRLIDYLKQKIFDLQAIEAVVLDEADRMFDLGFIKDIRFLLRRMPPPEARLGLLFSATLSYRVTELAYEHMNHPQLVKIATDTITAERVRQWCYMTANADKIPLLLGLVRSWTDARIMVFVNTKREADRVWGYLQGNGINTAVLSGDVPQNKRLQLLRDFTDGTLPVLVGTDVAARGLHIPDVTHVVNYDLPEDPEDYVHRIGRTARAGAAGEAIGFVCETYAFYLPDIEAFIDAKIPILPVEASQLAEVDPRSRLRPDREDREERRDGRSAAPAPRRVDKPRPAPIPLPLIAALPEDSAPLAVVPTPVAAPLSLPPRRFSSYYQREPAALTSPLPGAPPSTPILATFTAATRRAQVPKPKRRRQATDA
ncbi:DEAD/DEAH box helicase [Chromatium okenii]|uniref:DEAD/DEAH box helicase n=1 Tax=Chromatium okenii TaxID=61644 RepID=UPI00190862E6|nr:DEAD/DEAH box helicase [Chromatium okenii]MBK1641374.1 DEAD/DEAH box helicase [Chromatium okenii]